MKYKKWNDSEKQYILNNHELMTDKEMSSELSQINSENITTQMVRRQRIKLNVKKSRGRPVKKNKKLTMENNI